MAAAFPPARQSQGAVLEMRLLAALLVAAAAAAAAGAGAAHDSLASLREGEYACPWGEEAGDGAGDGARLLGACLSPGACQELAAPRWGERRGAGGRRSCGLSAAGAGSLVCCPPRGAAGGDESEDAAAAQTDALHGRRAHAACKKYGGQRATSCYNFRASDGSNAVYTGDFPFFAALGYGNASAPRWLCGGALISERFVLTSAHCARGTPRLGAPVAVRLGDVDPRSAGGDWDGDAQQVGVAGAWPHPAHAPPAAYHDVGLLQLAAPARVSQAVRPACLYPEAAAPVAAAVHIALTVAPALPVFQGGAVGSRGAFYSRAEDGVAQEELQLVAAGECARLLSGRGPAMERGLEPSLQLCARSRRADGACAEAWVAGGPLAVKIAAPLCAHAVVGVAGAGALACAHGRPAAFTRLHTYLPWIEKIVWP